MTTTESPGLAPTTDLELTMSLGGTQPGKEDPSHHAGKAERKEQPLSALLLWATDYHQEAHMPAKGIIHRVVALKTPTVEPPLVSMLATWEPESSSKHCNKHQHTTQWIGGRLNSERESSPGEDPLHVPEKASQTKGVAALAQWQGQQNPSLCPSGSTVVAEQHHTDLMLLRPQRWEPL